MEGTDILKWLWFVIQIPWMIYLGIPFLAFFIYLILKIFKVRTPFERKAVLHEKDFEFAIIITAHQDIRFVHPLVDSIIKQTYQHFHVYVVADDCQGQDINFLSDKVTVLQPNPALHSKISSIRYAVERFRPSHEVMLILDSDNLLHPQFLNRVNRHFQKGYKVVQANFKPKNINTDFARMDAMGDMFNFFVEREFRMRLNISAAIWGSGISMEIDLYRQVEYSHMLGGFDKKLQTHLVLNTDRIAFATDIILYDEKIETGSGLEKQRTRWISSYFKYFKESFLVFWKGLLRFDFNLIYFGFIILRPPLFLVILFAFFAATVNYFFWSSMFWVWVTIFFSFLLSFAGIVIEKGRDWRFLTTFIKLPFFMARQIAALFQIKKAKRSFLKTEHTQLIYIDDILAP